MIEFEKNNIRLNNKTYNLKLFLNKQIIIFQLENNDSKKYEGAYTEFDLKNLDNYFQQGKNIQDNFEDFTYLFEGKKNYTIEEGDSFANFKIPYRNRNIIFHLIKKHDDIISYDTLSNKMKTIIDNNELILGIDLGTTYSCASVMLDKHIIVIQNSLGLRTTPSFVLFLENNKICVGELAKLQPSEEKNIIYNTKRLIGKNFDDKEVQSIKNSLSFKIERDNDFNLLKIKVNENDYYPDEISAMILKKIVKDSEYYLSKLLNKEIKIKNSIITTPAYFNNNQRKAVLNAADMINLKVKRIINEPTSASLAYLYDNLSNVEKKILVLDLGGGTFDITFLNLTQTKNSSYCDIKCTGGDPNFGGEDFDNILMKTCIQSINQNMSDNNLNNNIRLKRACENAKINLSSKNETNIFLEEFLPSVNINFSITKDQFEKLCSELFSKFEKILRDFLRDNNLDINTITEVIPIGGATLMPKIKEIMKNIFGESKIKTNLNPKEVVAIGAAVQGGIISKLDNLRNYDLLDITNYSLGVELVGEKMSKIIKKYTPIPIEQVKNYVNAFDYPNSIEIKVYEGENQNINDNLFLGKFNILNLPHKKEGEININVKFYINANSILEVTAYERENRNTEKKKFDIQKNNENNEIRVENPNGLFLIMNALKNKENSIEYIEDELYRDTIKDLILKGEKEINDLKIKENGENNNKETIREKNKFIIEKFYTFIKEKLVKFNEGNKNNINEGEENNIIQEEKNNRRKYESKLILSYIKYYFKKVVYYLKNNKNDKIFRQTLFNSQNLGFILTENNI